MGTDARTAGPAVMAGADLTTVCRAVLAPSSSDYLAELGVPPSDLDQIPPIATMLMRHQDVLAMTHSYVDLGRFVGRLALNLTEPGQFRALDTLLVIAQSYATGHQDRQQHTLWSSHVLSRLNELASGEPPGVSPAGRAALLAAHRAYEARSVLVGEILEATDWEVVAGSKSGNDDLDLLAVLVERRHFLQFAMRVSSSLDRNELAAFLQWGSNLAGAVLSLPRSRW